MKVLVFMTQFYELNGAERLAVELAEALNKRGIRADILSMYTEDLPGVPAAKQDLLRRGVPAVHFLGMQIHPAVTALASSIYRLRRLIRKQQYDIVETSMLSPTVLASWSTRHTMARHIVGVHDVFRKDRYHNVHHRVWRFSVKCNRCIRCYAISDFVKRHWIEYMGIPVEHVRTVYNAIPNDCFEAVPQRDNVLQELGIPVGAKVALFVGRMLKRKGIDTVLDALGPILHEQNLYLLYIGGWSQPPEGFFADEDGLLDRMKEQIASKGWAERVRFLGRRNDVPRLMASCDILVHPARIEGFGLVLAEALAAGLPVVASNVQGVPEVLAGTDSVMIPPDNPEALREAVLKTLRRTPEEAALCAKSGRAKAEEFRIEKRIDNMVRLFQDVLAEDE